MKRGLLQILSIALIYCGTVFGAGFASGQEIVSFFSAHFFWGTLSSVFIGLLFILFGFLVCGGARKLQVDNAKDYFLSLFPRGVATFLYNLCSAFLVVTFCIMVAGCGTLVCEQFSVRPIVGALLSLLLCYYIIKNRVSGLARFNGIVTPLMFLGVVALCVIALRQSPKEFDGVASSPVQAAFFGILYIGYNMVSAVAVLVPSAAIASTKRKAALGGAIGGVFVAIPLVLMSIVLAGAPSVHHEELPFFSLIGAIYPALQPFCSIILYCAMLTTAASSGVSVLAQLPQKSVGKYAFLLCFVALFVSFVPFSVLVKTMYTIFGVCGIVLILGILKSFLRKQ